MFAMPAARLSPALAAEIARRHYGVSATAERLPSEFDDTFRLVGPDGCWLLKVGADPVAGPGPGVGFQTALLLHLAAVAPELPVQRVVATLDGRAEIAVAVPFDEPAGGSGRLVRMTSWLDGRLLGAGASSAGLRRDIGGTLARLNVALRGFTHPGAGRTHRWDLQRFGALGPLLAELPADG